MSAQPWRVRKATSTLRAEAYRASEALDERYFSREALEGQIKGWARGIIDLTERVDLLERVAHAAWHLMDDSGEAETTADDGRSDYWHFGLDHERLSAALDALEAGGWEVHSEGGQE